MSYRQRSTYQEKNVFANKTTNKGRTSNNIHRDVNKLDEESTSPVGPTKDAYGYIGFTSQDS